MTHERWAAPPGSGVALLERAMSYTLGSLNLVTPAALSHPTPCRDWDLQALLEHLNDSFTALQEAIDFGRVGLDSPEPGADWRARLGAAPVLSLRSRAARLLGAWTGAGGPQVVSVGGRPLARSVVIGAGAIEVAVHGWDVAQACRARRPIPSSLAESLLHLAALVVADADRPERFAAPVDVPPSAGPSDRLIAFLGRQPG